jgi:hypothetical protein
MTVFEYAIYSYGKKLMTPEEVDRALWLARRGDQGDQEAASALRRMVLDTIAERGRYKQAPLEMSATGRK